jgi:di/tricarboxylate transporter
MSRLALRLGNVLLLQGGASDLKAFAAGNVVSLFAGDEPERFESRRAPIAVAMFAGAIVAGTFNITPFPVAVLIGACLALMARCISPTEAYERIDWRVIILIGSLLALGRAMQDSGAAEFLASQILALAGDQSARLLLSCFFFLTLALTQPMSNQAAAILVLPIALQTALAIGLDPRPFAMMMALAASCSFITPLEPACLMVYGPGRFRFVDFVKVGSPLSVIVYLIAISLVPWVWPL